MSPRVDAAPSITVIVPAYNAADTLGRALDSLVVQTCQDFEAVVVDDASHDSSRSLAESYADRLPRLRVVARETNSGGVGAPRNDGIRAARGEFVMFLDSDDELPAKACELLLQTARTTGADITAGRAHRINTGRGTTQVWQSALYGADRTVDGVRDWPELIKDPIAAAKLYRRDFLLANEIFFPEGVFYEDTYFSAKSYTLASGISVLAEPVYRWMWEDPQGEAASITNRRAEIRSISDRIAVHRKTDAFLRDAGALDIKVHKDARFLTHDVRLYMKELRQGDEQFRTAFLELVSEYLGEIDERAYTLCGPLDRVRAFYLRNRLADEALTVADFEQRRSVVSTDLVRRGDRVYWSNRHTDLPGADEFLDVTELGLQNEPFESCKLFNQVSSLTLDGTTLTLEGGILNQFRRIGAGDSLKLVLHARAKETGQRSSVDVGDVRVDQTRVSYKVSFDLASLIAAFPAQGLVNLNMQVVWKGRKHSTSLCVRGIDLSPLDAVLEPAGLWADVSGSGNLVLRPIEKSADRYVPRKAPSAELWQWWQGRDMPVDPGAQDSPALTVAVFCADYGDALHTALRSLACQDAFARTQVLLVPGDGDIPSAAAEFADSYGNVGLVPADGPDGGEPSWRSVLDRAAGPYLAFMDGSGVLTEGALSRLLAAAADADADVVLGDTWQDSAALRETDMFLRGRFEGGDRSFDGVAAAPELLFAASPGGKLFRLELLREHGFYIGDGWDLGHITRVATALLHARRIRLVDTLVYGVTAEGRAARPAFDRRQAVRELLALCQSMLDASAEADPERQAAVRRFVAGSFHPYMTALPKMMVREELEAVYPRLRRLYQDIPDEVVLECAGPQPTLLTHHTVKAGNVRAFTRPFEEMRYLPELSVSGSALYRRLEGDEEISTLLRVEPRSARAESVRPVDGVLRFEGFLTLDPVDVDDRFGNSLELVFTTAGGREFAVPARQVYRRDRWHIRRGRDLHSGWRADLGSDELAALHGDAYALAVRLHGPGGFVDLPVVGRPAFHRFKGVDRVAGYRYEVSSDAEDVASVRVARRRSVAALADRARRFARETGRIAARQPGWFLRLLYWLTRPVLARRDIWIVGERQDTAQDNGYHFFRWTRQNHPRRNVYYVIAAGAADRAKVQDCGNVLALGSLKHRLYLLHATRLISPYDLEAYLAPPNVSKVDYLRAYGDLLRYRRVFLQHGVTYNDVSQSAHRQSTSVDLFVAASRDEAAYIREEMGYAEEEVQALGFPRFDKLQPVEGRPTVLLMPTWRRDIVVPSYNRKLRPRVQFQASEYFRFYSRMLEDERLRAALERSGVRLEFYPHYEIRPYLRHFRVDHPNITVADQTKRGVQEAMKECSLLVTDYSSVFFDVAYMGKPVVYVPFDEDDFYGRHYRRGYFELSNDGFGPVCRTVESAVDEIVAAIDRGFAVEEPYARRVEDFFGQRDTENCARVFRAIDGLDSPHRGKG
ncbi:bifunctional glycosyltransferase family 2 protein/CDP-glycerol:glycerophosphate glycerophosphotransferase [Streptomyces althioticus]|uniref:bifunctional glycosyltransferase/CDP-glycerol:glycerophosphate glycerophosphotransferase n=1 Tax=Streptomyces althioticus TaxID=83380 RepID=UPI003872C85C|nr:bifunctional glycosyltransferase family 2 protein/CDP-glycerol:glycerophosphate glycerophosphotransferase [Streptomyces althioticus]